VVADTPLVRRAVGRWLHSRQGRRVPSSGYRRRKEDRLSSLGDPYTTISLVSRADLVAVWTSRSLMAPDLAAALDTAAGRARTTVVLTHHHLARDHPVVATARVRLLTTHAPGDPPRRPVVNAYHVHLPPSPGHRDLAAAVARLVTPAEAG
jgi:hypothetical protein